MDSKELEDIRDIKLRLTIVEHKLAALEAKDKKNDADFDYYINQHGEIHRDLDRVAYEAYFKTHPEYRSSMDQYHKIADGKSKGSDEPKS